MGPKRKLSEKSVKQEQQPEKKVKRDSLELRRSTRRSAKTEQEPVQVKSPTSSKKKQGVKNETVSKTEVKTKKTVKTMRPIKEEPEITSDDVGDVSNGVTRSSKKFVGAHTSVSGGLENSIIDATKMGAKAFGLFLRSQRQWNCKPLQDEVAQKFIETRKQHGFLPEHILPHGSYLLNCGAPNEETLTKSRNALIDELQRCEKLGLVMYNFHPGSSCGIITTEECIEKIAESINQAHGATKYVTTLIENMSCQGHTIGGEFKQLRSIIDKVDDKSRIGVCLDTCHAFAAGYDLASEEGYNKMMDDFETIIGIRYLKAVHLNDSKGKVGCHLDRHENIGKGFIGIEGFQRIMNDSRFDNLPMILETPWVSDNINMKEISLLYSLCK